nr:reverse transcriptase domain-containing protein [uncultured Muribaculum sp.]
MGEYKALRKTKLKEMYIVRYADDVKVFCRTRRDAVKIKMATTDWINHRLKLQISEEKTSITNLKKHYSKFLGFKFKMRTKGKRQVIKTQMSEKAVKSATNKLKNQIRLIQKPENETQLYKRINVYNSMVMGIHNYYGIANCVSINLRSMQRNVSTVIKNRLTTAKQGKIENNYLAKRYGKSTQIRWIAGIPIMPIGYCKSRNPMNKKSSINQYTPEGRKELYEKPHGVLERVLCSIMRNPVKGRSIEYNDNRISLYMGQQGKCAITNEVFEIDKMHCHHIKPIHMGGTDEYKNLIFITDTVHKLIHATDENTVSKYLKITPLDEKQLKKLNKLRVQAGSEQIEQKM